MTGKRRWDGYEAATRMWRIVMRCEQWRVFHQWHVFCVRIGTADT
ncbi:hypothetical protein SCANM63S_04428 [Streptomyces canarius]